MTAATVRTDRSFTPDWPDEVRRLAAHRDAVVLAHNYQAPEIQDVADHVGDSLALSRIAAGTDATTIVFCGVHFMAETAKMLSPGKTVLVPTAAAGCSLADTIDADQLRAWKAEHPGAVVVAYVNTSAAVKAEADICCTSSNAVAGGRIDRRPTAGAVPARPVPRRPRPPDDRPRQHRDLDGRVPRARRHQPGRRARPGRRAPDAELLVHPECGCASSAIWLAGEGELPAGRTQILSTGAMVDAARTMTASTALVATEIGMLHQLRKVNRTRRSCR